jgi:hypothetical protein
MFGIEKRNNTKELIRAIESDDIKRAEKIIAEKKINDKKKVLIEGKGEITIRDWIKQKNESRIEDAQKICEQDNSSESLSQRRESKQEKLNKAFSNERQLEKVEELLKQGADPNADRILPGLWNTGDRHASPMRDAIKYGDINMVRLLMEYGYDPAKKRIEGGYFYDDELKMLTPSFDVDVDKTKRLEIMNINKLGTDERSRLIVSRTSITDLAREKLSKLVKAYIPELNRILAKPQVDVSHSENKFLKRRLFAIPEIVNMQKIVTMLNPEYQRSLILEKLDSGVKFCNDNKAMPDCNLIPEKEANFIKKSIMSADFGELSKVLRMLSSNSHSHLRGGISNELINAICDFKAKVRLAEKTKAEKTEAEKTENVRDTGKVKAKEKPGSMEHNF